MKKHIKDFARRLEAFLRGEKDEAIANYIQRLPRKKYDFGQKKKYQELPWGPGKPVTTKPSRLTAIVRAAVDNNKRYNLTKPAHGRRPTGVKKVRRMLQRLAKEQHENSQTSKS